MIIAAVSLQAVMIYRMQQVRLSEDLSSTCLRTAMIMHLHRQTLKTLELLVPRIAQCQGQVQMTGE